MNKNNESPVSQRNPLLPFLFPQIGFIIIILLRFILLFPSYIFDILLNIYSLAISILFIVFYRRKMKYAWHSLVLIYVPLFPIYLYMTINVGNQLSYVVSIVWVGVIFIILNWRKRYFKYIEQENGIIPSSEQTK